MGHKTFQTTRTMTITCRYNWGVYDGPVPQGANQKQSTYWNFKQWILLFPLNIILWFLIGRAIGLGVPSINPQHWCKGHLLLQLPERTTLDLAKLGLMMWANDWTAHRYHPSPTKEKKRKLLHVLAIITVNSATSHYVCTGLLDFCLRVWLQYCFIISMICYFVENKTELRFIPSEHWNKVAPSIGVHKSSQQNHEGFHSCALGSLYTFIICW